MYLHCRYGESELLSRDFGERKESDSAAKLRVVDSPATGWFLGLRV